MAKVEKLSIALTPEMAAMVREAVAGGEYASASEVVREALRGWRHRKEVEQQDFSALRRLWQEGVGADGGAKPADQVLDRLRAKYLAAR